MPWRCAALEDLDDEHATAAAWARAREGRLVAIMMIGIGSLALGLLATEQLAGAIDVVGAGGLGEQAVVADAVQALGQDVDEEAADELVCCERHHLVAIGAFEPIVLVFEADSVFVERDQPAVGDGDAVGVAGQIRQYRLGSGEGAFAVDVPSDLAQWRQQGDEGSSLGELTMLAEELQLTGGMCSDELFQHQPAE